MSEIATPFDSEIGELMEQSELIRTKLTLLRNKRESFIQCRGQVDSAFSHWIQKITPRSRNLGQYRAWHPRFGEVVRFGNISKVAAHGLVIYPARTAARDPYDYGRGDVDVSSYAHYLASDAASQPLTYASDSLDELLPDDKILEEWITYYVLTYNGKAYEHVEKNGETTSS